MNYKESYTSPCAETVMLQLEQTVAVSYNQNDGTEIIGTDNPYDL